MGSDMHMIKNLIYNSFVEPFKNPQLTVTYLATVTAFVGLFLLQIVVVFDLADLGLFALLSFFLTRAIFSNLIYMPLALLAFRKFPVSAIMIVLCGMQLVGTCAIVSGVLNADIILLSLAMCLVQCCFWVAFHLMMLLNISDKNRGGEIVLADTGMTVGMFLGGFLSGAALLYGYSEVAVGAGVALLSFASWLLCVRVRALMSEGDGMLPGQYHGSVRENFKATPSQLFVTIVEAGFMTVTDFLAPVWMKLMGISGVVVGAIASAQVVLKIMVAPFCGLLTNRGNGDELRVGAFLKMLGWAPWVFFHTPWLIFASSSLWKVGQQMFGVGMMSLWYGRRTVSSLAVREMLLGVGRIVTYLIALPLMFKSLDLFIYFCLMLTVVLMGMSYAMKVTGSRIPAA